MSELFFYRNLATDSEDSRDLHLTECAGRQVFDSHTAARRFRNEMLGVDFVERLEVRDLREEARRLDDVPHVGAGFLEHGLDVAAALLCLLLNRRGDDLALGSYDGVFFVPEGFIADINLDDLDSDIYRGDTADVDLDNNGRIEGNERDMRRYDNDLESAEDRD